MDTLTHGLAGNLLARTKTFKNYTDPQRKSVLWLMTVAAIFPDFDFIYRFIGKDAYLYYHRTITHSLIGLVLFPLVVGLYYHLKNKPLKWMHASLTFFLGMLSHILLDLITSWHTYLLYPSRKSFYLDWVFIIDLFLSGIIVLGLILSYRKSCFKRARYFSLAATIYILCCGIAHQSALKKADKLAIDRGETEFKLIALPRPFNPLNWNIFVNAPKHIYLQNIFLGLSESKIGIFQKTEHPIVEKILHTPPYQLFMQFARLPHITVTPLNQGYEIKLNDLRFSGTLLGKMSPKFSMEIKTDSAGNIYHSHWEKTDSTQLLKAKQ